MADIPYVRQPVDAEYDAFDDARGGNPYPELIRDTPRKPLRVFLLAATRDVN